MNIEKKIKLGETLVSNTFSLVQKIGNYRQRNKMTCPRVMLSQLPLSFVHITSFSLRLFLILFNCNTSLKFFYV